MNEPYWLNRIRGIDVETPQSKTDFVLIDGADQVAQAISERKDSES